MEHANWLTTSLIYLAAAVIAVPLARALGLGSIIGYLGAGILFTTSELSRCRDVETPPASARVRSQTPLMYHSTPRHAQVARRALDGVAPTVYALGLTSLLTDVPRKVTSILPLYLVFALQLSPLHGLLDAVYQARAMARLAGGWLPTAGSATSSRAAGYGLSAVCKLGWLAAGTSWPALSARHGDRSRRQRDPHRAARRADLAGQRAAAHGLSFGVHRAFDSAGALLGPLVAFAILAALPEAYDVVFVASFCIALAGPRRVAAAGAQPSGQRSRGRAPHRSRKRWAAAREALAHGAAGRGRARPGHRRRPLLLSAPARSAALPVAWFPLLFLGTALTYLALAVPAGKLADRIGRGRVILLGHTLLLAACLCLLASHSTSCGARWRWRCSAPTTPAPTVC